MLTFLISDCILYTNFICAKKQKTALNKNRMLQGSWRKQCFTLYDYMIKHFLHALCVLNVAVIRSSVCGTIRSFDEIQIGHKLK